MLPILGDAHDRPPLRVEGKDLQLNRQVDLTHVYADWHGKYDRSEVEDARHPCRDKPVTHPLRRPGRGGDHPDRYSLARADRLDLVSALDHVTSDLGADDGGVGVEDRRYPEAAGSEAAVVRQRPPKVAGPDDDHWPVLRQPEFAGNLVDEVVDVVADAAGAVGTQVGEVLAQLGRVHSRGRGELLARHRGDPLLGTGIENPQVHREAGDRRLRDALTAMACGWAAGHAPGCSRGMD